VEVIIGVVTALARHTFILPPLAPNPTSQQFFNWFPGFLGVLIPLVASIFIVTVVFFPIAQGARSSCPLNGIDKGQAGPRGIDQIRCFKTDFDVGVEHRGRNHRPVGVIALIVPGIILSIMFTLAFPVLLIENRGVFDSMGRSRELVGHRWLKTFAAFLVLMIIVAIASAIVDAISAPFRHRKPSGQRPPFGILSAPIPDTPCRLLLLQPRQACPR